MVRRMRLEFPINLSQTKREKMEFKPNVEAGP